MIKLHLPLPLAGARPADVCRGARSFLGRGLHTPMSGFAATLKRPTEGEVRAAQTSPASEGNLAAPRHTRQSRDNTWM